MESEGREGLGFSSGSGLRGSVFQAFILLVRGLGFNVLEIWGLRVQGFRVVGVESLGFRGLGFRCVGL